MTVCQDNTIRFMEAKIELYEIIENMSKIAENNLSSSRVVEKDFETLMDLMKETISSAKYVVGFLKVIFDLTQQSSQTNPPSSKEVFSDPKVGGDDGNTAGDVNQNTEKDNCNDDLDESSGSLYNSFEEVHFFETPKNISKRKKGRNVGGSSFEDSLNTSIENESLAVEMFGADNVLSHNIIEEDCDIKEAVNEVVGSVVDPGDPLIMSYADICKLNAPAFETPRVKVNDTRSWRNCRKDVRFSGLEGEKDNLDDSAEPLETKVDDEAFTQEFYEFAVKGNSKDDITGTTNLSLEDLVCEDLEYEVPGTPIIPASARTSSSSRTSDYVTEGFSFGQKVDNSNDLETPKRILEEKLSEILAGVTKSPTLESPNLKQDLDTCVNSTQELKISRKLSVLDQEKFLLEPISPIVSVEPKSPAIPVKQISPVPEIRLNQEGDGPKQSSINHDNIKQSFTVIQDSRIPSFRNQKSNEESDILDTTRPITPVSAANSTFITDQSTSATNSTFNSSLLQYREPPKIDESNLDFSKNLEVPSESDFQVDPSPTLQLDPSPLHLIIDLEPPLPSGIKFDPPPLPPALHFDTPSLPPASHFDTPSLSPAIQVPVVSTPTQLKTILGKKSHRLAKKVKFTDDSEVYYFPRSQGWVSVPKEGGNTLGMEESHFFSELVPMVDKENWDISSNLADPYAENEPARALRPRKSARLSISTTAKHRKFLDTEKKSPEKETESKEWKSTLKKPGVIKLTRVSESKSLPIISENDDNSYIEKSPEPVKSTRKFRNNRSFQVTQICDNTLDCTADTSVLNTSKSVRTGELGTRGLDRISSRKRKVILKSSGVDHLDPKEAEELRIIRENRGRVGCDCRGACNPARCSCAVEGIQCHQERAGAPCQCSETECNNPAGRYKFDPTQVQMHFIQTIMETQGAFSIN